MPSVFNNMQIWSFTPANRWQGQTSQQMDSPNPTCKGGSLVWTSSQLFLMWACIQVHVTGGPTWKNPHFIHPFSMVSEKQSELTRVRGRQGYFEPLKCEAAAWKKNARRTSFDLPIFLTKSNLKRRFQLGGKKKFPLLIISTFPTSTILMWCVWSCNLVWNRPPWTSQKLHSRKTFPFHWIGLKTRLYLLFFFDASDHEMAEGLPWTRVRLCCHTTNLLRTPPNGPRLHHDQFIQRLEVIQLPFSAFTHENAC